MRTQWTVPRAQTALKGAAAVAVAVLAVGTTDDRPFVLLAAAAVLGLGALALRDLLVPVRLAADDEGLTVVAGFAGHRRIPWDEVTTIRVDERRRLLSNTRLLEIETGDDLHLLSAFDLGTDVRDVAEALAEMRPA
ncbi:PH domain-containing protein [Spirillospora sp. CA-294931]|uniref:PH domain-containing protein n=1 Tax=Spirillospora sp. CA-294931 TaxID=3240042 RepID=UPI003D925250